DPENNRRSPPHRDAFSRGFFFQGVFNLHALVNTEEKDQDQRRQSDQKNQRPQNAKIQRRTSQTRTGPDLGIHRIVNKDRVLAAGFVLLYFVQGLCEFTHILFPEDRNRMEFALFSLSALSSQ